MSSLISAARESGTINPAYFEGQIVSLIPYGQTKYKTKYRTKKQAYIQLPDMTFAMSGSSYMIATEGQIWEMRSAYLEKFPTVTVAESEAKKQLELSRESDTIRVLCNDFVKNFTGNDFRACYDNLEEYQAISKDLEKALSMYDYDSIATVMTENDEAFLQYFRLSRTFEGDFKTISQILAEYNIERRRIEKQLTMSKIM